MQQIGIWRIEQNGPVRLAGASVQLEGHLEEWIKRDASLLQRGLAIVGSQINLGESGRLDLLAIDQQGQWVIIEIKRGAVDRLTIAQAIDYASAVAAMPFSRLSALLRPEAPGLQQLLADRQAVETDENSSRDVRIIVVGTGQAPGLQRMVDFLSPDKLSIEVVLFQAFELADGDRVLVRQMLEQENVPEEDTRYRTRSVEALTEVARQNGLGTDFERLLELARRHGLYLRPFKNSVMLAPQANRTRTLITVWAVPFESGKLYVLVVPEAFAEFFGVTDEQAREKLVFDRWLNLTSDEVTALIENVDRFFGSLQPPGE